MVVQNIQCTTPPLSQHRASRSLSYIRVFPPKIPGSISPPQNRHLAAPSSRYTPPETSAHLYTQRVIFLLRCGGTNPKFGRTPVPGLAQCPSPPSASTDHGLLRPPGLLSGQTPAGCFYARANSGMPGAEMAISYAARLTVVKSARLACQQCTISPAISFFGRQVGKMYRQMPSNLQFANSGCAGNIIAMRHLFPQN